MLVRLEGKSSNTIESEDLAQSIDVVMVEILLSSFKRNAHLSLSSLACCFLNSLSFGKNNRSTKLEEFEFVKYLKFASIPLPLSFKTLGAIVRSDFLDKTQKYGK